MLLCLRCQSGSAWPVSRFPGHRVFGAHCCAPVASRKVPIGVGDAASRVTCGACIVLVCPAIMCVRACQAGRRGRATRLVPASSEPALRRGVGQRSAAAFAPEALNSFCACLLQKGARPPMVVLLVFYEPVGRGSSSSGAPQKTYEDPHYRTSNPQYRNRKQRTSCKAEKLLSTKCCGQATQDITQ